MTLYDFSAKNIAGETVSLDQYRGKVVLVVNTASKCGFTPQYEGLQKLYDSYEDLVVLGFPCDQFGHQEPGDENEIAEFCKLNFGVTFPLFAKIDVNGAEAHDLFVWLKEELSGLLGSGIKWNFTKFLIDREGKPIKRFAPKDKPEKLVEEIEKLL
jgi:glutathione peroxidase